MKILFRPIYLLSSLVAGALVYLIMRTATFALYPTAVMALPPINSTELMRPMIQAAAQSGSPVPREISAWSQRAMTISPLSFEPFFIEAQVAKQKNEIGRAIQLMEAAKRRHPSFIMTRLQLMTLYNQAGRSTEMLEEMDFVLRGSSEAQQVFLPELVKILAHSAGRDALAKMLVRKPSWQTFFFKAAKDADISPEDARAFAQLFQNEELYQQAWTVYLERLISNGRYKEARSAWLRQLSKREQSQYSLLSNGLFLPGDSPPPFSWVFYDIGVGHAELRNESGERPHLFAEYFGGRRAVLAEQRTALASGTYKIQFLARTQSGVGSNEFFLTLTCLPSGDEAMRARVEPPQRYIPMTANFSISRSGCDGQVLRLQAVPGDLSTPADLQISELKMSYAR